MTITEFENHGLVSIIRSLSVFKKYCEKYASPLSHYTVLSDKLMRSFMSLATCEDIAYYFMAVQNRKHNDMPAVLSSLSRQYNQFELPNTEGILSKSYWENWAINHIIDIMDFTKFWQEHPTISDNRQPIQKLSEGY